MNSGQDRWSRPCYATHGEMWRFSRPPRRRTAPQASFADRAMIKTSVRSAWDDEGTPEVVWFSLFTRDGAEYRAERRVLVPENFHPREGAPGAGPRAPWC